MGLDTMSAPFFSRRGLWVLALAGLSGLACGRKEPLVATVGPLKITRAEFRRKLAEVAENYQNYVLTPNGRRQFLDILIREKLILAAARASDVPKSQEFLAQMERLRADEEERLREGKEYLLTRLWLEELRAKGVLKAGEEDARDYHRRHPVEVQVRHILLATPEEAEVAAKKARGGANFAMLAKSKSLDSATASDGGRMRSSLFGEVIPELEDVVFRTKVGEISGPIKSKFGYHVLKKEGERRLSFAEARERIERLLEKQKLDRHLQSVQEKFPVEVLDEEFK
ncbi:MAG: peptidylprolyl isomerase [Elusimicrobia bacterium]|nr:peptidylprolyl isomerase [Elusimicrobiota bacterium]